MPQANKYWWVEQKCPICRVVPTKRIGRRGGDAHRQGLGVACEVFRCGECELIFPNPMPIPVGGTAQHYDVPSDEYFKAHDSNAKVAAGRALLRVARELAGKDKGDLLDIGCGRGEILKAAVDAGWNALGVEPSATFARSAEALSGATILNEEIEGFDRPDHSTDVVVLSAVLEHLYDPDRMISRIVRWLRPNGALFLDVPNERGLYFRAGNLYNRLRGRDWVVNLAPTFAPFHTFGFSPKSLKKLLHKHGLIETHWRMYPGETMVPKGGFVGTLEAIAAKGVATFSRIGGLETYIETWAVKK